MKYINKILFGALVVGTALGFGSCKKHQGGASQEIPVPVSVTDLRLGSISKFVEASGTVQPKGKVELASEMAGAYRLRRNPKTGRPYALGDKVRKGEVIIKLEDKEYENGIRFESSKLSLDINKQELEKQKKLYEKGGVTLRDMRNSEKSYIDATYAFEDSKIKMDKMLIKAPFDGVITDLPYFSNGVKVKNGEALATVMSYKQLLLEVKLPAKDFMDLKSGQQVLVTNHNLPDDTLKGEVREISPSIDETTRTFKSKITIENSGMLLRPGMFVQANIEVARADSVVVVPKDYLLARRHGKSVFVVEKTRAKERRLRLGIQNKDFVEVKAGLSKGDRMVTKGFETLGNEAKVKVLQ
ncbi:hemolysin D [Fulvitalea axinellae]|uniref:Hemolysin D n=1 Tax=Fulvitalea axinellae TaxID=1182444 RepID=A0AAU9CYU3_9BACT|nr:hemolysin D [Fulvitalea axinellae]